MNCIIHKLLWTPLDPIIEYIIVSFKITKRLMHRHVILKKMHSKLKQTASSFMKRYWHNNICWCIKKIMMLNKWKLPSIQSIHLISMLHITILWASRALPYRQGLQSKSIWRSLQFISSLNEELFRTCC